MQIVDLGHGRGWLDAPAAASVRRVDAKLGHAAQITEAGRTWKRQNQHWQAYQRYLDGGPWAPIALSPDAPSIHQLGNAADSDEWQQHVSLLAEHGWRRTVYRKVNGVWKLVEPWHFEYFRDRDQHRYDPAPAGEGENDDMTPEERTMLTEVHSMLLEVRGALGAAGGHNMPTENTIGHKVNEMRDYLGAAGGKGTTTPNTIGHKVNVIHRKITSGA